MDTFITLVFLLLSFTVAIHFMTLILIKSSNRFPIMRFVNAFMVFVFRLVWIPLALLIFIIIFDVTVPAVWFVMCLLTSIAIINALASIRHLQSSFKRSILDIRKKYLDYNEQTELDEKKKYQLTFLEKHILQLTRNYYNVNEENADTFLELIRGEKDNSVVKIEKPKDGILSRIRRSLRLKKGAKLLDAQANKSQLKTTEMIDLSIPNGLNPLHASELADVENNFANDNQNSNNNNNNANFSHVIEKNGKNVHQVQVQGNQQPTFELSNKLANDSDDENVP